VSPFIQDKFTAKNMAVIKKENTVILIILLTALILIVAVWLFYDWQIEQLMQKPK
jgi:uncharacterized membrane protein YidH (DUF202 family)